jgi:hypothetical protein
MLKGASVIWKSRRQQIVALSTAEAEYVALIAVAVSLLKLNASTNQF